MTLITALVMFFWLLVGHALCDYPLQGDFLAKAKNHTAAIPSVPFYQALVAHALIHAGMVAFVTRSPACAVFEFLAHTKIDYDKCAGKWSYDQDQAWHVLCKAIYVIELAIRVHS